MKGLSFITMLAVFGGYVLVLLPPAPLVVISAAPKLCHYNFYQLLSCDDLSFVDSNEEEGAGRKKVYSSKTKPVGLEEVGLWKEDGGPPKWMV